MTDLAKEFNFDGLVGPTHNYAGLAHGNLASQENRNLVSHPRQAALQGLEKMRWLTNLGIPQAVLPPQQRPAMWALRRFGFDGSDADVLAAAAHHAPHLLAACASASAMWVANAATVSPSADTADQRVHMTPANLARHLHRSLEKSDTARMLRAVFPGPRFVHHDPLPNSPQMVDEGAANHLRLCAQHGSPGIELFVFGNDPAGAARTARFVPRQTRDASEAVARLHQLLRERSVFAQQSPEAIDAGVFHNDVIALAHRDILLYHERAFVEGERIVDVLRRDFLRLTGAELQAIRIPLALLSLEDAVRSYLFNSQLVTRPNGSPVIVVPQECREIAAARAALDFIAERIPGLEVHHVDVRESMRNGGGPACLRLRVVLTAQQEAAMPSGVRLTDELYVQLRKVVEHYYREDLQPVDLADPQLLAESRAVQRALAQLGLPAPIDSAEI